MKTILVWMNAHPFLSMGLLFVVVVVIWLWWEVKNAPLYDEETGTFIYDSKK